MKVRIVGSLQVRRRQNTEQVRREIDTFRKGAQPIRGPRPLEHMFLAQSGKGQLVLLVPSDASMLAFTVPPRLEAMIRSTPPTQVPDRPAGGGASSAIQAAALEQAKADPAPGGEGGAGKPLNYPLSPIAESLIGEAMSTLLSGGTLNNAVLNSVGNPLQLGMAAIGQALDGVISGVMEGWEVDDSSSTGEFAAKAAVQKVVDQIKSQAMSMATSAALGGEAGPDAIEQIEDFFGAIQSTAKDEAALFGTPDDAGNFVRAVTAETVLISTCTTASALSGDVVDPAGKPIIAGSRTVRVCGGAHMVARATSPTAAPSTLKPTGVKVLVGGPSPHPIATRKAAEQFAANGDAAGATETSDRISNAADRAGTRAQLAGASPEDCAAARDRAAEQAAAQQPVGEKVMAGLNKAGYRDGQPGLVDTEPKPELQGGDTVYVDPETGAQYTEQELLEMERLGMNPSTQMCDAGASDVIRDIRDSSEQWAVEYVHDSSSDPSLASGYRMVAFRRESDGQLVLVYSGTSSTSPTDPDWLNNLAQGVGLNSLAPQYAQAAEHADQYFDHDAGLIITGHSLGGGLASFAGGHVGATTVMFNPAGLGSTSMAELATTGQPLRPDQFTTYVVEGEVLTGWSSTWVQQPEYFGHTHQLTPPDGVGMVAAHQMEVIIEAMNMGPTECLGVVSPHIPPSIATKDRV